MMRKLLLFFILFSISLGAVSQKKEKIKGSRVIAKESNKLDDFHSIEISDNLHVTISKNNSNSYELQADENLIEVLKFEIDDHVLKIYSTKKITSSKKLEIELNYEEIDAIILKDDSKLDSKNKIEFPAFSIETYDSSHFDLDMEVDSLNLNLFSNSSGKINLHGKKATIELEDKSELKGNISLDSLIMSMNEKSLVKVNGDINNLKLDAKGSSTLKANDLKVSTANLNTSNSTDISIFVSKELRLYASEKSSINLYGNPKLQVDALNDQSKIVKK